MKELNWQATKVLTVKDLDPITADNLAQQIIDQFDEWRRLRLGYEMVWNAIDRHLNQYDPVQTPVQKFEYGQTIDGPAYSGSKLKMSNVYAHREGIVAAIMKFLMVNDYDFFDIIPLDPMDQEATQAVKEYLLWLFDIMDFETEFLPFLRALITYGTAIASYEWVKETATRWKKQIIEDPFTGQEQVIQYKRDEVIYNAPKFTPLNLYRAVIDPMGKDPQTATLIFQKLLTPFEMMANPAYSGLTDKYIQEAPDAGPDKDSVWESLRETYQGNTTYNATTAFKGKKTVYEAWGDFTDGERLFQNYVAEVFNGKLIRFEPNPYDMPHKPFVVARFSVEPGSIYGRSPLAGITAIQAGYDTLVNQVLDSNSMHNERPILLQANSLIQDKNDKKSVPPLGKNSIWRVRDINCAQRMRDPDYEGVANSMQLLEVLDNQQKLYTGNNELLSGGSGINDQYATTGHVVTVAEAGNARFNLYSKTIEREAIVPILEMTIDLLRQQSLQPMTFQTKDTSLGQSVQFHPEMLLNNMAFSLRGASYNATKQLQVNAMQAFYQMVLTSPVTQPIFNWIRVAIDMGDAMGIRGIRNQIAPQALATLSQMPQGPNWWQNVINLFQQKQAGQAPVLPGLPGPAGVGGPALPPAGPPQGPPSMQNIPQAHPLGGPPLGQQFTTPLAPAFGGHGGPNGQSSPFNLTPPTAPLPGVGASAGPTGRGRRTGFA